jgi:hypothetical protein
MFVMVNMQVADIKNIKTIRGRISRNGSQSAGGETQKSSQKEQKR